MNFGLPDPPYWTGPQDDAGRVDACFAPLGPAILPVAAPVAPSATPTTAAGRTHAKMRLFTLPPWSLDAVRGEYVWIRSLFQLLSTSARRFGLRVVLLPRQEHNAAEPRRAPPIGIGDEAALDLGVDESGAAGGVRHNAVAPSEPTETACSSAASPSGGTGPVADQRVRRFPLTTVPASVPSEPRT